MIDHVCSSGCRDLMSIAELSPEHKFKDLDVSCFSRNIVCNLVPRPHSLVRKNGRVNQVELFGPACVLRLT